MKKFHAFAQFIFNFLDCAQHRIARCDVVRSGINRETRDFLHHFSCQWVKQLHGLHFIVKHAQTQRKIGILRWENINRIATHSKRPARKINFIAVVLHHCELLDDVALRYFIARAQHQLHAMVFLWITYPVNTRDRPHDNHIAPLEQAFGRRQTHLLDMLINRRVFFDE